MISSSCGGKSGGCGRKVVGCKGGDVEAHSMKEGTSLLNSVSGTKSAKGSRSSPLRPYFEKCCL